MFNTQGIKDLDSYLTVKSAADFSGYNQQYLRRLLRENVFRSRRIGQLWLIERDDFLKYLANGECRINCVNGLS
ncbi:MAG: helix-turn-helix domain-containing protein, partial [Chloroflexi bacterium]|nr:helix-turn-helix domain-containing protein [Chloroflexota bacterium]